MPSGICIRSGHTAPSPLHRHYGLASSPGLSLSFNTTFEEIDRFATKLRKQRWAFLKEHG